MVRAWHILGVGLTFRVRDGGREGGLKVEAKTNSRKSTWYCSSLACSSSGRLEMALR